MTINHWKAELFRIKKEKHFLVSYLILTLLLGLGAWMFRDTRGPELSLSILSIVSSFLPLFFLAPATVFFGEEFAQRTINNQLVRAEKRQSIFANRSLFTLVFSFAYVLYSYLLTGLISLVLAGNFPIGLLVDNFVKQVPFYLCLIALLIFLSNYLDKIYQVNTVYIILALMADQLVSFLLGNFVQASLYQPFLIFSQVSNVLGQTSLDWASITIALAGTVFYLAVSSAIFQKKEFK